MDSRRTADRDISYPDQRLERAELMRSRTKRTASWPAGFGLASTGRTYDRNRLEQSRQKVLPIGRPHMVGIADPRMELLRRFSAEWDLR
jgi:hypothetical protein